MAGVLMSLSESIKVNVLLENQLRQQHHHQQQQQLRQQQLQQKAQQQQQGRTQTIAVEEPSGGDGLQQHRDGRPGVSMCRQFLLVTVLCSTEMIMAWEQIYFVPILQYLDVPLYLVSVNGIIAGGCSIALLPWIGVFTDRGRNPRSRKICVVLTSMAVFISGLCLVSSCGFVKIIQFGDSNTTPLTPLINNYSAKIDNLTDHLEYLTTLPSHPLPEPTPGPFHLTSVAYLSILAFALVDAAFDTSTSITRAFLLEIIPSFQHTSILVGATLAQALSGMTVSVFGCLDLPGILGSLFNTDGTGAMLVFFSILLIFVVLVCSITTFATVRCIDKGRSPSEKLGFGARLLKEKMTQTSLNFVKMSVETSLSRLTSRGSKKELQTDHKPFVADILHTEEGDTSTKPLLLEDSLKGYNYAAISENTSVTCPAIPEDTAVPAGPRRAMFRIASEESMASHRNVDEAEETHPSETPDDLPAMAAFNSGFGGRAERMSRGNSTASLLSAIKQSFSMSRSASMVHPPLGDFHTRRINHLNATQRALGAQQVLKANATYRKQLISLCISTFFLYGSFISYSMYISNAVTVGMYHGDPGAAPGTEGRARYEKGLQTSAFGILAQYTGYMLTSLLMQKLILLIDEKVIFMNCVTLYCLLNGILVITQRLETYYISIVMAGHLKANVYSLPYILAQKFTHERHEKTAAFADGKETAIQYGRVMAMIGFSLPLHYVIMSILMGPLMDSTGNVWVPVIYSIGSGICAGLAFMPLFWVKS